MGDINKMIQWFTTREGKVSYSQAERFGPHSYDCSSAVYYALIESGFIPKGSMGWTGSLHDVTLPSIATKISRKDCRRGDIFLSKYWANDGHTGLFLDNSTIIHCSYGKNGIYKTSTEGGWMGPAPTEYYRLNNSIDSGGNGSTTMQCIYWKPNSKGNGKDAYYFNGVNIKYINHPDGVYILKDIYQKNKGKILPEYTWDNKAPWWIRLEQVAKGE